MRGDPSMAHRPVFRLPEGCRIEVTPTHVDLTYEGDVEIEQELGRPFGTVRAGGDLTVKLAKVTGNLVAGGVLRVRGPVDGGTLHGREVVLGRQAVRCRAITADERITIGAADLVVDVILAPEIAIDAKATGRVTVIESANERGPTKIKGGFTLADFEDTFGRSVAFLAERGVRPLPGREPGAHVPAAADAAAAPEPSATNAESPSVVERAREPADPVFHRRLTDALGRIAACYEGEGPPALRELRRLVDQQDYEGLRGGLGDAWNAVLGYHRQRGIRPHHQVTYAFNLLHGLVS
jgi:hypothetical protein